MTRHAAPLWLLMLPHPAGETAHICECILRIPDCSSTGTCGGLWADAHAAAGAPYAKDVSELARATGRTHPDASLYAGKAAVVARMLDALQLQEGEDDTVRFSGVGLRIG
jgi:hypothetical protein